MKKILVVFVVAMLTLTSCKQNKIGYVDIAKVMKEYEAVKDLEKEMQDKSATFQAKYEQIASSIDQQVRQGKITPQQAQAKAQELQAEYKSLQDESQKRSDKIVDNLKSFVKEYAKKNGYTFIFGANDSGNVLYGDEKMDLTDVLTDAINEDYENGSKTATKEDKKESTSESKDTVK